jgi:hypothetical protein
MKHMSKHGWSKLIALMAAFACVESWAVNQVRRHGDSAEVANMTGKKKTVCIGRFLLDVPNQLSNIRRLGRQEIFDHESILLSSRHSVAKLM